MSISGKFKVHPQGRGDGLDIAQFSIISTDDNKFHAYHIMLRGGKELSGEIPKSKSGHGNILHLLKDVLRDLDLRGELDALPENYSTIR